MFFHITWHSSMIKQNFNHNWLLTLFLGLKEIWKIRTFHGSSVKWLKRVTPSANDTGHRLKNSKLFLQKYQQDCCFFIAVFRNDVFDNIQFYIKNKLLYFRHPIVLVFYFSAQAKWCGNVMFSLKKTEVLKMSFLYVFYVSKHKNTFSERRRCCCR